ncbi:hypothetical protein Q9Q99_06605 [Curtobacterium flaccumfaciens]|nr:hypothetical protein Q9Q99_06605 [Curtobacterium flaccumfaciens]
MLADVLTPELDRIRQEDADDRRAAADRGAGADELATITRRGINAVVEHVMTHRDIYGKALPDPNDASLHRLLVEHFTVSSALHIRELDPARRPDLLDDVAAGFVAQGVRRGDRGLARRAPTVAEGAGGDDHAVVPGVVELSGLLLLGVGRLAVGGLALRLLTTLQRLHDLDRRRRGGRVVAL